MKTSVWFRKKKKRKKLQKSSFLIFPDVSRIQVTTKLKNVKYIFYLSGGLNKVHHQQQQQVKGLMGSEKSQR